MKNICILLISYCFLLSSCADRPSAEETKATEKVFDDANKCMSKKQAKYEKEGTSISFSMPLFLAAKADTCRSSDIASAKANYECVLKACTSESSHANLISEFEKCPQIMYRADCKAIGANIMR